MVKVRVPRKGLLQCWKESVGAGKKAWVLGSSNSSVTIASRRRDWFQVGLA